MISKNLVIFVILSLVASLLGANFTLAENLYESKSGPEFGDAKTAGNPGILSTSPFYFFKELRRGLQGFLTVNSIKKIEVELLHMTELGAEIQKLQETSANRNALKKTLENYKDNLNKLGGHLNSVKEVDRYIDRMFEELANIGLRHGYLFRFSQLRDKDGEINELGEMNEIKLYELLASAAAKDDPAKFEERWRKIVFDSLNPLIEIKNLGILIRFSDYLEGELREKIELLKEDLSLKFEGRLQTGEIPKEKLTEFFESLNARPMDKIKILEEIRENISDPETKTELNILRQKILEANSFSESFRKEAKKETSLILNQVEVFIKQLEKNPAQKNHLEKTRLHFDQAKKYLDNKEYDGALSQAVSALVTAKNSLFKKDFLQGEEKNAIVKQLKEKYDALFSSGPGLESLLKEAEKSIIELSSKDAIAKATVKKAKIILYAIESAARQPKTGN